MAELIRRYWFLAGLLAVCLLTLGDVSGTVASAGKWLKLHRGPDLVIFFIFLFSGILLRTDQVRAGFRDAGGTFLSLGVIFVLSPLAALLFSWLPLTHGVRIGLFLVAVMPTTLSSGVVMTGAAGGNMAHALMITILANLIAVFSIPLVLAALLGTGGVSIDKAAIMLKLCGFVILPLSLGAWGRALMARRIPGLLNRVTPFLANASQVLVLGIVWMAMAQSKAVILGSGGEVFSILVLSFCYHIVLVAAAAGGCRFFGIGPGRRESVIFMGGQKTLPLSVILQVSLFPDLGLALVVCVLHHIIHLMMDSWLVGRMDAAR